MKVCLRQLSFTTGLIQIDTMALRLNDYASQRRGMKPEASRLLQEALIRGEFSRSEISRITGLPERTARRMFSSLLAEGLLACDTPKGPVSLRFPVKTHDGLLPRLFQQA